MFKVQRLRKVELYTRFVRLPRIRYSAIIRKTDLNDFKKKKNVGGTRAKMLKIFGKPYCYGNARRRQVDICFPFTKTNRWHTQFFKNGFIELYEVI